MTQSNQHLQQEIQERISTEAALQESEARYREQAHQLELAFRQLQETQSQLVHSEKMSSLGQLVAGVAHEINNPVNFIYGNLTHAHHYTQDLLDLLSLYIKHTPAPPPEIKLDFIQFKVGVIFDGAWIAGGLSNFFRCSAFNRYQEKSTENLTGYNYCH